MSLPPLLPPTLHRDKEPVQVWGVGPLCLSFGLDFGRHYRDRESQAPKSSGKRVCILFPHTEHLEGPRKILLSGYKLCFYLNWGSYKGPREQSLRKVSQKKKSEKRRWGQDSSREWCSYLL